MRLMMLMASSISTVLRKPGCQLGDRLRAIPGAEIVRIYGQPSEEIQVTVDVEALAERGLTPRQVAEAFRRADVKVPACRGRRETENP